MSAAHDAGLSESSSGYEDGLGRRVLVFDRESGEMRERLRLRPELRVFITLLQERVPRVADLDDERFAKPRAIETDADGRLVVVSDYVAGQRLSDLVDAAAEQGIVAGLDAGLGLLLEILPALSRLHDAGLTHGALAPGRLIITPSGQIVLVDAIYADALERLQLTRKRLWSELRLAFPSTAGAPRFDKAADLTHAAMTAAALIVGRPLRDDEYTEGLAALRQEIVEIASIRASKGFAEAVDGFFTALLPLPTRKTALTSADEAAIDLRKLLRREVGITTCRNAMLEFFQQVDTAERDRVQTALVDQTREETARQEAERVELARVEAEHAAREEAERIARDADRQAREEADRKAREEAERKARQEAERKAREEAERKAREEAERKAREEAERKAREEAERKAREEAERKAREEAERKAREEAERKAREEAERKAREEAERKARAEAERKAREEAERKAREEAERKAREEAERKTREEAERKARAEAERKAREEAERKTREEAERQARAEAERRERERIEAERLEQERVARERAEAEQRARAEAEQRERADADARERAERERQAAAELAAAVPPPPSKSGWLVPPDRATVFEATAAPEQTPQATARAYPIYQPPAESASWTPELGPAPTIEIGPVAASTPSSPAKHGSILSIRLQEDGGVHPAGPARAESRQEPEQMSAADAYLPFGSQEETRPIPWKLIAGGVLLIAVTFGLTKGFLPSEIPVPTLGNLRPIVQLKKAPPPAVPASSGAGGHLAITTEPAGARILLDGKFVGTAPMTIDAITPGRHVVTLQGDSGAIRKSVRIEPGKTVSLDVPVFSGFAVISAPIVLDVAENGRALGTSDNQIMLGAGHHEVHLENKDLSYSGTLAIDVEPGETAHLTVDPRGRANINAIPWAEVYVDGESIGQTPLANVAIRLGVREIVFKNPQFPDRKIVTTIKSGEPATITVDFTKDKLQ
jgi:membrane protein involved in colicin uptake